MSESRPALFQVFYYDVRVHKGTLKDVLDKF